MPNSRTSKGGMERRDGMEGREMTQEQKDKISQVIADLKNEMPEQVDLADLYCAEPFMGSCYGWDDSLGYALDNAIKLFEELRDQPGETCTVEPSKSARSEPGSPTTQLDAADRLRWLLSQAERVVTVDAEDRAAVDRACKLLKDIDNGFDAVRT